MVLHSSLTEDGPSAQVGGFFFGDVPGLSRAHQIHQHTDHNGDQSATAYRQRLASAFGELLWLVGGHYISLLAMMPASPSARDGCVAACLCNLTPEPSTLNCTPAPSSA